MELIDTAFAMGATGLGVGYLYWRARAGYGRSRGLPPGSLGLRTSLRALFDDRFYLEEARKRGPIFKIRQFHHRVICVVGLERGARLLHEYEDVLRAPALTFNRAIPRGFIRYMEASDHARYAPLFRAAFSPELVRASEPFIEECLRRELDRMAADGRRASPAGVGLDAYLRRAVFAAFARVFFGIAPETPPFTRLEEIYRGTDHERLLRAGRSDGRRIEELRTLLSERQAGGDGNGATPCVIRNLLSVEPEALADPTVAGNVAFMFEIACDDVTGLLRWVVKKIADHPEWLARVRAARRDGLQAARDVAQRVVQETLRLEQSEYIYRVVQRDIAFEEFTIPRGWLIRICVRESHRSPAVFTAPEAFDPDRFVERHASKTEYAPFGMGRHACFGAQLALTIGRALVAELARYDLSIAADGERSRLRWRHWAHWVPSPRLRVVLSPRT